MAICQELVAAMGGALEAESAVGQGTRFPFALELPAAIWPHHRGEDAHTTLAPMRAA